VTELLSLKWVLHAGCQHCLGHIRIIEPEVTELEALVDYWLVSMLGLIGLERHDEFRWFSVVGRWRTGSFHLAS
jgi:hypothetical protein